MIRAVAMHRIPCLLALFTLGCCAPPAGYESLAREHGELVDEIEAVFELLDRDGDGRLVASELVGAFESLLEESDLDGDGALTREELLESLGPSLLSAHFHAHGTDLVMVGLIDGRTPERLERALREHPRTRRLVLAKVDGSIDHEAVFAAGRLVRARGLATHVPEDGWIASGGVDLFLAGRARSAAQGAEIGVHSWVFELLDLPLEGRDLPRDHPEHREQIEYLRELGIPEDFYWFTLEAASADELHWMSPEELARFGLLTEEPVATR